MEMHIAIRGVCGDGTSPRRRGFGRAWGRLPLQAEHSADLSMLTVLIYVLILWGIIALAWVVAWWLRRRGPDTSGQFTNTAVFVGFLFGFLLTTLQVFATNHYSDARSQAQSEPTSLVTMYDDLGVFPPRGPPGGHRVIICYRWSVAERDWKAQEREDPQETPDTVAWGDRLRD